MAATWTVVKFITDNTVEAVPTSWVENDKCAWPNYTKERLVKAIKTCEPPSSCWNHHDIVSFRSATYSNYATARQKAMKAEETSDLNSDCDMPKRLKKPKPLWADTEYEKFDDSSTDSQNSDVGANLECPQINLQRRPSDITNHESESTNHHRATEKEISGLRLSEDMLEDNNNNNGGSSTSSSMSKCTCCQLHKQEVALTTGLLKQIMRKLTIMEMDICDIKRVMDKTHVYAPVSENVWGEFEIPLTNMESLTAFDEFLNNKENMEKSIIELSRIGGDNANEFMKRAMARLITHKLAAEFSWVGLKKKRVFSKLNMTDLLIRSAQRNEKTASQSVKEMEDGIKKILRRATERAFAEEKRLSKRD